MPRYMILYSINCSVEVEADSFDDAKEKYESMEHSRDNEDSFELDSIVDLDNDAELLF